MRINTNTAAMNTYSNLTSANASKSNSLAKLSSGLRINKAGDDAAGLAISEKMKNQVSGMTQASRNAQDGISLIQTAEGALGETHSILNRMRDLTVQAANGTNTEDDKTAIQAELTSLTSEVDRIADDTKFNTQGLMNNVTIDKTSVGGLFTASGTAAENNNKKLALAIQKVDTTKGSLAVDGTATDEKLTEALNDLTPDKLDKVIVQYNNTKLEGVAKLAKSDLGEVKDKNFDFQIGANAGEKISVKIENMTTKGLDIKGINVNTQSTDDILGKLDNAISEVSTQRANLGAVQNRLDHTVSNLATTKENLSEANSRITDVDMAEEMMSFTKSNILSQASTSMLAQANQMPQSVLSLLQ